MPLDTPVTAQTSASTNSSSMNAEDNPEDDPDWPFAVITNNDPNFKFKYPEASPTPPGEDDIVWNKVYTAADSRMYNKNGKDAKNSRKFRISGETRSLAISMLKDNKMKYKQKKAAEASGATSKPKPAPKPTAPKATSSQKASILSEPTIGGDAVPMSISEKIKSEGRNRKAASVAPSATASSCRGTPPLVQKSDSPAPSIKMEKGPTRKKGTAALVKKHSTKKQKLDSAFPSPCIIHLANQKKVTATQALH
jgi:COMPASS component SPP1